MNNSPNATEALQALYTIIKKNGTNLLVYLVFASLTAAPIVMAQVQSTRGPGSATYLNEVDFHIMGPDRAFVGDLIRLTVSDYEPTDVAWGVIGDSEKYGLHDTNLVFSSPTPGSVEVTCGIIRGGELYLTSKIVEILVYDEVPVVEPTPIPEPTPAPVVSKIGRQIVSLCHDHRISKATAGQVAKNLRQATEDRQNTSPRALLSRTVDLNKGEAIDEDGNLIKGTKASLSEDASEAIGVFLQTLSEDGQLVDMEQHLLVWEQMAEGFTTYAN